MKIVARIGLGSYLNDPSNKTGVSNLCERRLDTAIAADL